MESAAINAITRWPGLPPRVVEQVALAEAEQCALIANRHATAAGQDGEPIDVCIGADILAAFTPSPYAGLSSKASRIGEAGTKPLSLAPAVRGPRP